MREQDGKEGQTTGSMTEILYEELRRIARAKMKGERANHTLQATILVNEAYLRLKENKQNKPWKDEEQFMRAAANVMRQILIDYARKKNADKREHDKTELDESRIEGGASLDELLAIDEALKRFEKAYPRAAEVVKLRYFVGYTIDEIADMFGCSDGTVKRDWAFARAWLKKETKNENL